MRRALLLALFATTVPSPALAEAFRDCPMCPLLVVIPPGSYIKGSPPGEAAAEGTPARDTRNETPQSDIDVERFAISKYEITRGEFGAFVAQQGYDPEWACKTWDFDSDAWGTRDTRWTWDNPGFPQGADHPVLCVSYTDAQAYVAWLSDKTGHRYRLLTDEEWEYVARAGTQTARPWPGARGAACEHANVTDLDTAERLRIDPSVADNHVFPCRDGYALTAPVGSFPANALGVHDMLGNAWEWVEGCMSAPGAAGEPAQENCNERLIRGGAWQARAWYVRSAKRDWAPFFLRSARVGLRVARDLAPAPAARGR